MDTVLFNKIFETITAQIKIASPLEKKENNFRLPT